MTENPWLAINSEGENSKIPKYELKSSLYGRPVQSGQGREWYSYLIESPIVQPIIGRRHVDQLADTMAAKYRSNHVSMCSKRFR